MLAASALMVAGVAAAQESPPNLQMLLNLDLFEGDTGGGHGSGDHDSMVEQIRALDALGYLHPKRNNPHAAEPESTVVKDLPAGGQNSGGGENQ